MGMRMYLYLWAVATCLSVLVTITWDLRMDWGLLQGYGLLREEMVYRQQVPFPGLQPQIHTPAPLSTELL